jgi:uncharacterized protein with PIN domain
MDDLFNSIIFSNQIHKSGNPMTVFQNGMTHCPKCHKPLFNGGHFSGWAEFCLRCPWCQTAVAVTIQPKITASIKDAEGETVVDQKSAFYSSEGEYEAGLEQLIELKNKAEESSQ